MHPKVFLLIVLVGLMFAAIANAYDWSGKPSEYIFFPDQQISTDYNSCHFQW